MPEGWHHLRDTQGEDPVRGMSRGIAVTKDDVIQAGLDVLKDYPCDEYTKVVLEHIILGDWTSAEVVDYILSVAPQRKLSMSGRQECQP